MVSHQLVEEEAPATNPATNLAAPPDLLDLTSPFVFPAPTPTGAVSAVSHATSGPTTGLFNFGVAQTDAAAVPFCSHPLPWPQ